MGAEDEGVRSGPGAQARHAFQRRRGESSKRAGSFSQAVAIDWNTHCNGLNSKLKP